ncbi:hypothetical protein ACLBWP_16190 [Microbacterium sp. M1A1_1b]|uniref:hypothetical protein n=1 Tax=Curtobacterium sp. VKM Ac-2922 TaxID=2929475 RepID=UPI001FB4ED97|nr:hypothetical protein [Curtobacterium sp. VKM Ac-2922]MCJ1713066.1 hypothetical protein [Curtobacterium sp. VKM Ac-2922]
MGNSTRERLIALAGVVAALLPAVDGVAGLATLTTWYPGRGVLATGAVVAALCAVVIGLGAWRRADRTTLALALSVVLFALTWLPVPLGLWPISAIALLASQALLIAFGVLVARRSTGLTRITGWSVAAGGIVWLLGGLVTWFGAVPNASQELLGALFVIAPLGMLIGFLAAAVLFAGPLLRPVAQGARYLWSTAEVR